jgi:hypothetical protein
MSDVDKLTEMVNGYDDEIQQLEDSITRLTEVSDDLGEQRAAIENVVLSELVSGSNTYLEQKAILVCSGGYPTTCTYCTSGSYGTGNLTEWAIVSGGCPPSSHEVLFKSSDVSPSVDPDQYQRQLDFDEAYDHIWKTIDTSGTYGIQPNRDNIDTGKSILEINKTKIEDVKAIYEQYI